MTLGSDSDSAFPCEVLGRLLTFLCLICQMERMNVGLRSLCGALKEIVVLKNYDIITKTEQTHLECAFISMLVPDSVFSVSEIWKRETVKYGERKEKKERVEIE